MSEACLGHLAPDVIREVTILKLDHRVWTDLLTLRDLDLLLPPEVLHLSHTN